MISLYDSMTQSARPLELRDPGKVSLYVCGPTVYDAPHIGHGRFTLVYDVLRRFLTWQGLEVNFVSNITDIEDKIIDRANEEGTDIFTVTKHWEQVWWETMDQLNVLRPTETPHATDYVTQMVALVEELLESGAAYKTSDGVYLSVSDIEGYGELSNQTLESLRTGASDREVVGVDKAHPQDFVLWKLSKPGEPSWPSPWGDGRPGWHTECVVMSLDILGEGFDLHTGGLDLKFPHHENELAQAKAAGKEFCRHWMHNGFVESGGEKMSKSLGNTYNLIDLVNDYGGAVYRLLILQTHYRSPIEVTQDTLVAAKQSLERIKALFRRAEGTDVGVVPATVEAEFTAAMEDDMDTPKVMQLLFDSVRDANAAFDASDDAKAATHVASVKFFVEVIGLEVDLVDDVPAEVQALCEQRTDARSEGNYDRADQLRDELLTLGWAVEDLAGGARPYKIS